MQNSAAIRRSPASDRAIRASEYRNSSRADLVVDAHLIDALDFAEPTNRGDAFE
jgi:hypothetical protein